MCVRQDQTFAGSAIRPSRRTEYWDRNQALQAEDGNQALQAEDAAVVLLEEAFPSRPPYYGSQRLRGVNRDVLHETAEQHDPYKKTHTEHDCWDWYA